MFKLSGLNPVLLILFALFGAGLFAFMVMVIRRFVARIRVREDYDEDVDLNQTKEEKEAFLKVKEEEKAFLRVSFVDAAKEKKKRTVILSILGFVSAIVLTLYCNNFHAHDIKFYFVIGILFLFYMIMTMESFIDFDTMEIPPELNVAIFVLGLISVWAFGDLNRIISHGDWSGIINRVIGALCIALPMIIIDLIIANAFGGGDIKLMAAAGFLLGWRMTLMGFFFGAIIGAVIGIVAMARKKKKGKEHIPFGPSLCMGLAIAVIYGEPLVNWYLGMVKSMMTMD